VVMRR